MNRHLLTLAAGAALLVALLLTPASPGPTAAAGGQGKEGGDPMAIKARTRDLLAALGKGNARELAEFWTTAGEYSREEATVRGRTNIEKAYAEALKKKTTRTLVV